MQSMDLIRDFLKDRLGNEPQHLTEDTLLTDLGVDSLMLAELMFEAEDKLGISIESDQTPPATVGEMVAIIDALVASKNA